MIDNDKIGDKIISVNKINGWYVSKGELPRKNN